MKQTLTDREKQILVTLRRSGVAPATLSTAFGVFTRSIAAFMANDTRKA